jgi:transforming growth factor-beta-induced protein
MASALFRAFVFVSFATGVAALAACSSDDSSSSSPTPAPTTTGTTPPAGPKDIVDTAIAAGNFTTLAGALTKAGLVDTLKGPGPFTVFAPTDAAFAKLGDISGLTADQLKPILTYHVHKGAAKAADVLGLNGQIIQTVNADADLAITIAGTKVILNNGKKRAGTISQTDIVASNGIIHVLDTVLDPNDKPTDVVQTAIDNGGFTKLAGALTKAELVPTLKGAGPFTVFAPTDAAFAKLGDISALTKADLTPILTYHVLPGKTVAADVVKASGSRVPTVLSASGGANAGKSVKITVQNGSVFLDYAVKVSATDIIATNGVVHVIDNVLSPLDITEKAAATPALSTLVAALGAGDLVTALQADGPFTVFAPTNAAFAGIQSTTDALLLPANKAKLQQVLKYHVLGAAVPAADVLGLNGKNTPNTLEGLPIKVTITGTSVFLDQAPGSNAQVATADIFTRNGIVHVVDKVLVPSDFVAP